MKFKSLFSKKNKNKKTENLSDKNYLLDNFYNNLKLFDFQPKHIVDIGANHGTWTREALIHFPNSHYTLIEPQYWLKSSLHTYF